jgi:hypothetical protein
VLSLNFSRGYIDISKLNGMMQAMNISKRLRASVIALASLGAISLAACGGGSSASSPIPSPTVKPASKATLRAAFVGSGSLAASALHRSTEALASDLIPSEDYYIPNADVSFSGMGGTGQYIAIAYYDTTTSPAPSPIPSGTWTQAGNPLYPYTTLGTGAPLTFSGASLPSTEVLASFEGIGNPTTTGVTTVTYTDTLGASTSINGYTYNADVLNDGRVSYTGQPCLTFNANQTTTPGATGDLCLVVTNVSNSGVTSLVAANGAVLIAKTIDTITAADIATLPATGPTTILSSAVLTDQDTVGGGAATIIVRTASGAIAKMGFLGAVTGPSGNLANGQVDYFYGGYRVGTTSGFDF